MMIMVVDVVFDIFVMLDCVKVRVMVVFDVMGEELMLRFVCYSLVFGYVFVVSVMLQVEIVRLVLILYLMVIESILVWEICVGILMIMGGLGMFIVGGGGGGGGVGVLSMFGVMDVLGVGLGVLMMGRGLGFGDDIVVGVGVGLGKVWCMSCFVVCDEVVIVGFLMSVVVIFILSVVVVMVVMMVRFVLLVMRLVIGKVMVVGIGVVFVDMFVEVRVFYICVLVFMVMFVGKRIVSICELVCFVFVVFVWQLVYLLRCVWMCWLFCGVR